MPAAGSSRRLADLNRRDGEATAECQVLSCFTEKIATFFPAADAMVAVRRPAGFDRRDGEFTA